jgi:hypothetical protein
MDIRDDVFGPAPLGAPNRISAAGKRCQGNVGTLSITPCIYGRLTALFVSAALALTIAGEARAARGARAAPRRSMHKQSMRPSCRHRPVKRSAPALPVRPPS